MRGPDKPSRRPVPLLLGAAAAAQAPTHPAPPVGPAERATLGFDSRRNVTCDGWPGPLDVVHGGEVVVSSALARLRQNL